MSTDTQIAIRESGVIDVSNDGLRFNTFEALEKFADYLCKSAFAPEHLKNNKAGTVVAMAYGMEIGLGPLQAVQGVKVIKGKPSVDGDTGLALVMGKNLVEWKKEWIEHEDDVAKAVAYCEIKRVGQPEPCRRSFSWQDAVRAGLTGSDTYKKYWQRMLRYRALGFVLRDLFPDVLKGLYTAEEAGDFPDPPTGGGNVVSMPGSQSSEPVSRTEELKRRLQAASPTPAEANEPDAIDAVIEPDEPPTAPAETTGSAVVEASAGAPSSESVKLISAAGIKMLEGRMEGWSQEMRDAFFFEFSVGRVQDLPASVFREAQDWIEERNGNTGALFSEQDDPFEDGLDPSDGEKINEEQLRELNRECETRKLSDAQVNEICDWLKADDFGQILWSAFARAKKLIVASALCEYTRSSMATAVKHYRVTHVSELSDEQVATIVTRLQDKASKKTTAQTGGAK